MRCQWRNDLRQTLWYPTSRIDVFVGLMLRNNQHLISSPTSVNTVGLETKGPRLHRLEAKPRCLPATRADTEKFPPRCFELIKVLYIAEQQGSMLRTKVLNLVLSQTTSVLFIFGPGGNIVLSRGTAASVPTAYAYKEHSMLC